VIRQISRRWIAKYGEPKVIEGGPVVLPVSIGG
jgi:hypothetical protein